MYQAGCTIFSCPQTSSFACKSPVGVSEILYYDLSGFTCVVHYCISVPRYDAAPYHLCLEVMGDMIDGVPEILARCRSWLYMFVEAFVVLGIVALAIPRCGLVGQCSSRPLVHADGIFESDMLDADMLGSGIHGSKWS